MEAVMDTQVELWQRVNCAKRKVLDVFGGKPDAQFRASQLYQAYTGLCGEAEFEHDDKQLDEETVAMLEEYAVKVIQAWQEHATAR
jgi:hypothetical protein